MFGWSVGGHLFLLLYSREKAVGAAAERSEGKATRVVRENEQKKGNVYKASDKPLTTTENGSHDQRALNAERVRLPSRKRWQA